MEGGLGGVKDGLITVAFMMICVGTVWTGGLSWVWFKMVYP